VADNSKDRKQTEIVQSIKQKAKEYRDYTADCLSQLVQLPSLSCDEEAVIQRIKALLTAAGVSNCRIDGLGNLIATVGSGSRKIAIDAHIDTVDTGDESQWQTPPFSGLIKDGWVHGRGSVDQKGGAAAMITAARILTELGYNGPFQICFTFTVMEEDCDGLCWEYLINKEKIIPEFAVITEPTNLGLYRGHRGRMELEIYLKGVSAHGSAPERGQNVIYGGARLALKIKELQQRLATDPFLGKGSIAPTLFQTKAPSLCAIPDHARLHVDRRLTWGENKESAIRELENIAGKNSTVVVPEYERKSYTGTRYCQEKYFPTWKIPQDHLLVQAGMQTYQNLFNKSVRPGKWTFSTNGVSLCGRHQIPCIGFGPGNEIYAHAPNERVPIDHLTKAGAFYAFLPHVLGGL